MARYAVSNLLAGSQQVLSTTAKTQVSLTSPATVRRAWIDEVIVGADQQAVSTDCQIRWNWMKQTAVGTSTSLTPNPTPDGSDAAALTLATGNSTAEPTYTTASSMLAFDTNQRQSQRIAFPDYRLTPLIVPATSANGFAATALSTNYNGTVVVQEYFVE